MRVHLRTPGNARSIRQKARPHSRALLTHAEQTKASEGYNPVANLTGRIGDASSVQRHAEVLQRTSVLHRTNHGQKVRTLTQLQRQYGNRYVQRALALSRKGGDRAEATSEVEQAIQRARGGGQALDSGVRAQMEPAFGADFGGVRVHANAEADALNRSLNARAFTTGQDIFFRQGAYNPGGSSGRELLAHELTHVVQQTGGTRPKLTVGQPGDRYEQEADQVARAVMQREQQGAQKGVDKGLVRRQVEEEEEEREKLIKTKPISGTTGLVIQRRFINRGRTATDRVWWAGGTGATGFVPGSIQTLVIPTLRGRNPRRPSSVARAWIRPRSGRIRVARFYIGVRRGDQGGGAGNRWFLTRRAARRTNRHERIHIRTSRNLYRRYISPLLRLVRRYRGRRRALRYGSTQAEAIARLRTIVGWNTSVNDFRNQDTVFNQPGGTVDRNEPAAGTDLVDCGAGNVGGIHYDHRAMAPDECP